MRLLRVVQRGQKSESTLANSSRKIEPEGPRPTYIHAVPGIGYRFERRGLNERLSRSQELSAESDHENGIFETEALSLGGATHAAAG